MAQKVFEIDRSILSDGKATNKTAELEAIFKEAEDTISDGGRVIIVQNFENAPKEVIREITKKSELDKIKNSYLD